MFLCLINLSTTPLRLWGGGEGIAPPFMTAALDSGIALLLACYNFNKLIYMYFTNVTTSDEIGYRGGDKET
jgi:hypothetical protein